MRSNLGLPVADQPDGTEAERLGTSCNQSGGGKSTGLGKRSFPSATGGATHALSADMGSYLRRRRSVTTSLTASTTASGASN